MTSYPSLTLLPYAAKTINSYAVIKISDICDLELSLNSVFFSIAAECFTACDPSILVTAEGPDLCKLTKSVDELLDLVKTTVNRDLSKGIPVLVSVVKLTNLFIDNPLSGIANITDILKDIEIVHNLVVTTNADTQQILRDLSDVANTLTRLLTTIMSGTRR